MKSSIYSNKEYKLSIIRKVDRKDNSRFLFLPQINKEFPNNPFTPLTWRFSAYNIIIKKKLNLYATSDNKVFLSKYNTLLSKKELLSLYFNDSQKYMPYIPKANKIRKRNSYYISKTIGLLLYNNELIINNNINLNNKINNLNNSIFLEYNFKKFKNLFLLSDSILDSRAFTRFLILYYLNKPTTGPFKIFTPRIPSFRHTKLISRVFLYKKKPIKSLLVGKNRTYRKNGKIIFRTKGSGHKRNYRMVDFNRRNHSGVYGIVTRVEYDPNRSSFISLVLFRNGIYSYFLTPTGQRIGDLIQSYFYRPQNRWFFYKQGDHACLRSIPPSSLIYNIELHPGNGGQITRSSGNFCTVVRHLPYLNRTLIKFRKGKRFTVLSSNCMASFGRVSNKLNRDTIMGKAGRNRWRGRRPIVRGVARNPVDHPHGGGEGKGSKHINPKNLWGKMLKWKKTSRTSSTFDVNEVNRIIFFYENRQVIRIS